ncbi:MAG: ABC transporter permease [Erysipelotrichaceae bacterium]|nr:ABC transporter permease [Erysipelotrichaceae bacterium]
MRSYFLKRLLTGALLIVSVSFLVFSLMYMMPGDPVDMVINEKVSQERKDQIAHELGYDLPFLEQYKNWVIKVAHNDFGISIKYRTPVWNLLNARIPYSLKLCGWSIVLEMILALPLGLYCAVHKDSLFDKIAVNTSLIFTAIPAFWLGALFIIIFAVKLKILPISGYSSFKHYILPVVTITLGSLGSTLKITKAEVLEVLNEKYVTTAYAKGLPRQTVLYKHVLRNALIIVVTILFMSLPWMITGAVITEKVFGMPGMGLLLVNSIVDQDIPVVQAVLLIIAILTVLCNLASDLITAILDPRIRVSMNGGEE